MLKITWHSIASIVLIKKIIKIGNINEKTTRWTLQFFGCDELIFDNGNT